MPSVTGSDQLLVDRLAVNSSSEARMWRTAICAGPVHHVRCTEPDLSTCPGLKIDRCAQKLMPQAGAHHAHRKAKFVVQEGLDILNRVSKLELQPRHV